MKLLALSWSFVITGFLLSPNLSAFESGSTGADGAFSPTSNIQIGIPEDGILNYTSFNIPENVTVKFAQNQTNTPVYILVQGDAVIDGTIDISGINGNDFGIAPPGSYAGGLGQQVNINGGNGFGPGGGSGGRSTSSSAIVGGVGGSYLTAGKVGGANAALSSLDQKIGSVYGNALLQPLLGGSGGGAPRFNNTGTVLGARGGGGGGAMLLAVSGTLTLDGQIIATGGDGGEMTSTSGGGGSGGAVRLVSSLLRGMGLIDVSGGLGEPNVNAPWGGGDGGTGRVRIEADNFDFTGQVTPVGVAYSSTPQPLFIATMPGIRVATVAGISVATNPNGVNDVILPSSITNPVTIEFEATNVPIGSTVQLLITPNVGASVTTTSTALSGTFESSTATVDVDLPQGSSTLLASVAFATSQQQAMALSRYTKGELVAKVELKNEMGTSPLVNLITETGKVFQVPSSVL